MMMTGKFLILLALALMAVGAANARARSTSTHHDRNGLISALMAVGAANVRARSTSTHHDRNGLKSALMSVGAANARARSTSTHHDRNGLKSVGNRPPKIVCPSNITTFTDPGKSFATVPFSVYAFDKKNTAIEFTCTPESHSPFNIGETEVTCSATKGHRHDSCSFFVIVKDKEVPIITCPEDILVSELLFEGGLNLNVSIPVTNAIDNAGTVTVECTHSGTVFLPEGTTTVVRCTATDEADNEACCEFEVTIANKFLDVFCLVEEIQLGIQCEPDSCVGVDLDENFAEEDTFCDENGVFLK